MCCVYVCCFPACLEIDFCLCFFKMEGLTVSLSVSGELSKAFRFLSSLLTLLLISFLLSKLDVEGNAFISFCWLFLWEVGLLTLFLGFSRTSES